MIRKIISIIILCFSFLCVSCGFFTEEDFGFPSKVQFTREGGEMTLQGTEYFAGATIKTNDLSYDAKKISENSGVEYWCAEYDWLKVKYYIKEYGVDTITIYVSPNTTGKKRKLYIWLESGYEYDVIKVEQDK